MATPIFFGTEFLINTTQTSTQNEPVITGLADGRFVVVWTDHSGSGADTSASAIRAQVFGADGTPVGAEFLVNTSIAETQYLPTVAALADGGFVMAWADFSQTGGDMSAFAIKAQRFNTDGSVAGAEFLVNTTTAFTQAEPAITTLANGRFVVAWTDFSATGGDTAGYAIRAQVFSADGTAFGTEFLVNTTVAGYQSAPTICALASGRFVVAWTDGSQTGGDTSGSAIRAQVFSANGSALGGEFLVNTSVASAQSVPAITALANGQFVVTWQDFSQSGGDTSNTSVRAQVLNADGSMSGTEFLVNTTTLSAQNAPTITALADGRFVVVWEDYSQTGGDNSGGGIRAQVFNTDGSLSGAEFLVNTSIVNNQFAPTITALADGRFAVAWVNLDVAFNSDILGQIFDPREAAVTLTGTVAADAYVGTLFGDTMSGALGNDVLVGGAGQDQLFGQQGRDILNGGTENDLLLGGNSNDQLIGGGGKDTLNGGLGVDRLAGGAGADTFVFSTAADAGTLLLHDKIKDFSAGSDGLNLSAIQAGQLFIGAAGFGNVAGQVRYDMATGILSGDLNGDSVADYVVELTSLPALTAGDLIL